MKEAVTAANAVSVEATRGRSHTRGQAERTQELRETGTVAPVEFRTKCFGSARRLRIAFIAAMALYQARLRCSRQLAHGARLQACRNGDFWGTLKMAKRDAYATITTAMRLEQRW